MPDGAALPVLDHELADDELQWMKSVYADFSKAKRELGWEPKIDLEEGIEMLFDWVQANKELF